MKTLAKMMILALLASSASFAGSGFNKQFSKTITLISASIFGKTIKQHNFKLYRSIDTYIDSHEHLDY